MGRREEEHARRRYDDFSRRLAELDRLDGIDLSGCGPRPPVRRSGLASGTIGTLVVAVLVVAGLVLGTGAWRDALRTDHSLEAEAEAAGAVDRAPTPEVLAGPSTWPPLPGDASTTRLSPAVATTETGAHTFLRRRPDGGPVGYDPCRPVRYVVNPAGMPAEGAQLVREAVASVSAATGLVFVDEGVTTEPLGERREAHQPARYGDRWAPVLIAWGDASTYPALAGDVAGVAGSVVVAPDGAGSERYVTGEVVLDRQDMTDILAWPDGYRQARAVVVHELGHLVGLGHVEETTSLMHERGTGHVELAAGDRQGLAAVGQGPCFRDT